MRKLLQISKHIFIIEGIDIKFLRSLDGIVSCPSNRTTSPKRGNHIHWTPYFSQVDDNTPTRAIFVEDSPSLVKTRSPIVNMRRICAVAMRTKGSGLKRFNVCEILGFLQFMRE